MRDYIDIVIGNNASSDNTLEVIARFREDWPSVSVLAHDQNLGADENFCQCISQVRTKYFWLMGDDDLPKTGVIKKLVTLLENEVPDLVYLTSEWCKQIVSAAQGIQVAQLNYTSMSGLNFARRVNVWATFISGMIVKRETFGLANGGVLMRRFAGTNLIQLGWVFENLKNGSKFVYVIDPCVLATAENSGGYAVIKVFGENFRKVTTSIFGINSPIAKALILRNIIGFLPALIWKTRFKNIGDYHHDDAMINSAVYAQERILYWILLRPVAALPKYLSLMFVLFSLVISRALAVCDRLRSR
jgi:glycosyltransferase involved in cell wall biosynthesis